MENIFRIKCGIHHFQVPYEYETNSIEGKGGTTELGGPFTDKSFQRAKAVLKELLRHVTRHLHTSGDLASAAIYAAALRRLAPNYQPGEFTPHDSFLHTNLNQRFGMNPPTYAYQAVDSLLQLIVDRLAEHGVSDAQ
jgi:5-carboxymethyl-2-hydroxymuconate isomerase